MTYNDTIDWLFQQLPMYQRVGKEAYKNKLDNIIALCNHLENPQNQFKTIHIAGTNGKGSTSHMLASILQEAGYKTGLHTSPHLKDFRERSRINGKMIPEDFVVNFIRKHQAFIKEIQASFFEVSVAMGFQFFAENKVDIAIIEVGLGGRLDSTNIINPVLSIITNIGLDHTAFLGETLQDIALEKAGIIKNHTPVVIGEFTEETQDAFIHKAKVHHAPIYFAQELDLPKYSTDLKGIYQNLNIRTATASIKILQDLGWNITSSNIQKGLSKVTQNTGLRGRWDILQQNPLTVADTAHNVAGIQHIIQQINSTPHQKLHLVLGFVNDKDASSIIKMFPQDAQFYFCEPNVPRKKKLEEIKKEVSPSIQAQYFKTVEEALEKAKASASENDFIYIGGSTFVVAEII